MIKTFKCSDTQKLFCGERVNAFQSFEISAVSKLNMLDAASELSDLSVFPSNKLEKLHGQRKGQYSIRINKQWRICFIWRENNAFDVEIVDYH